MLGRPSFCNVPTGYTLKSVPRNTRYARFGILNVVLPFPAPQYLWPRIDLRMSYGRPQLRCKASFLVVRMCLRNKIQFPDCCSLPHYQQLPSSRAISWGCLRYAYLYRRANKSFAKTERRKMSIGYGLCPWHYPFLSFRAMSKPPLLDTSMGRHSNC